MFNKHLLISLITQPQTFTVHIYYMAGTEMDAGIKKQDLHSTLNMLTVQVGEADMFNYDAV